MQLQKFPNLALYTNIPDVMLMKYILVEAMNLSQNEGEKTQGLFE